MEDDDRIINDDENLNYEDIVEETTDDNYEDLATDDDNVNYTPPKKIVNSTMDSNGKIRKRNSYIPPRKVRNLTLDENGNYTSSSVRETRSSTLDENGNYKSSKVRKISSSTFDEEKEEKGSGSFSFNRLSLKFKLVILGIATSCISTIVFIVILITPLIALGIIDIGDLGTSGIISSGYSSVSSNISHWWPVGSSNTNVLNNVTYANGVPFVTTITSNYSASEDFRNHIHKGIDIGNGGNGPGIVNIIATKNGTVIYPTSASQTGYNDNGYVGNNDGYGFGNYVMISHNDGTVTVYAHLAKNSITVFSGNTVKRGQVIAKMGNSGSSTGTHLHYEIRVNGNKVNPNDYVSASSPRP